MLEKPQEMVSYRQVELGGLGLNCVRTKAMAMLIDTFKAQAISPRFRTNQYHNNLYKWHVLEHRDIPFLLLETGVTYTSTDINVPPVIIKTRLEEKNPDVDFTMPYKLARLFSLSPEQKTFSFTHYYQPGTVWLGWRRF